MNIEQEQTPIKGFSFEGKWQTVSYVETMHVNEGVDCDVYTFDGDPSKDLGIIRITPGSKTPLQKVLQGNRTIEGYISGKGKLTITKLDGKQEVYTVGEESNKSLAVIVDIGELMQWEADTDSGLVAYEICFPPYEDGRFENTK